jgi:hypothetical protein
MRTDSKADQHLSAAYLLGRTVRQVSNIWLAYLDSESLLSAEKTGDR